IDPQGHAQGYTHSALQSISRPTTNEVTTSTKMALWTPPGTQVPVDHNLKGYGPTSQVLSNYTVSKDVTVGFGGLSNVIHHAATVNVPAADQLEQLQVQQIVFTTGSFTEDSDPLALTKIGIFDPATGVVSETQ